MRFPRVHVAVSAALAVASLAAFSTTANAESEFATGGSGTEATARLDFRITIPAVIYLQVGTGTFPTDVATIDLIDFIVPAADVGDGTEVAATAGSGDLGNGTVTVRVLGNFGDVDLTATTAGALANADGDTISWSEINVADGGSITHPVLVDGGPSDTTLAATGRVVNVDDTWTFSYANSDVVPAGEYGGIGGVGNGRITYTVTIP